MSTLYSAREIKSTYGITGQTLYNWRKAGNINFIKLDSGRLMYHLVHEESDIEANRMSVLYARVSNSKQKEDLRNQISILREYIGRQGEIVGELYQDIASGMNENRVGFNKLIKDVVDNKIDTVYITHNDRLTRFGFGYVKKFFEAHDTKIVVLNATTEEDFQTELTQDLISIIHHFSMKVYSNRRRELKAITKLMQEDK